MELNDEPMTGEQSLQLISEMITAAKTGIKDDGFFYLLWGWLVLVASLSQYALLFIWPSEYNGLPWAILMPLGGVVTMIASRRQKKKRKVKTFLDQFMGYALVAFLMSLFTVLFFMARLGRPELAYPLIMMVYGAWLFISGGALKFKLLMVGGIINWALAFAAMFVPFQGQLLLLALAVLLGYIIPGHLLKSGYQQE
jgi:hypothetical protein